MEILKLQAMEAKVVVENKQLPTSITLTTVTTTSTAI
ncbi:class III lanthipeptide [Streptomyces sp. NPDC004520]